ncbi:hypothetical protein FH972_004376 [Carpinus fangiana]|uniref:RIN4 pathogenic type III effector avirulence factor Avr cleavage site domain-containing protein n=1 Tax=Carpinus fangiana TaxID=176857 RepID=A0A5N6QNP1_9ROSI|nr:hypothetical protein FH972_004376 [Carpinus fangiana]
MVNPNDPEENPDLFSDNSSSAQGPTSRAIAEPEEPIRQKPGRSTHEPRRSREDGDLKQFTDNLGGRDNSEPPNQRHGGRGVSSGETHRRTARYSAEHSVERSPLHRQAKVPARDGGVNSYSLEGKASYENAHGTPGRSRMKPETRGDETPEKGTAVPKFGAWDENNPASAEGFTHIFDKVREERQTGVERIPGPNEISYNNTRRQNPDDSAKSCCLPWCRK